MATRRARSVIESDRGFTYVQYVVLSRVRHGITALPNQPVLDMFQCPLNIRAQVVKILNAAGITHKGLRNP
jgi:hypothetical protein